MSNLFKAMFALSRVSHKHIVKYLGTNCNIDKAECRAKELHFNIKGVVRQGIKGRK